MKWLKKFITWWIGINYLVLPMDTSCVDVITTSGKVTGSAPDLI